MKNFFSVGLVLACCGSPAAAATFHVDPFTSNQQMWTGGSQTGTMVTHAHTGGVPGGYVQVQSFGGNLATYNERADWVGNLGELAAGGQLEIKVALRSPATSEPLAIRFVLFGPGDTSNRWTSTTAQIVPTDNVWRNYTFSLAEADLTRVQGTASYAALMADTRRVMFRHDPGTPDASGMGSEVTGILGIDNAELALGEPTGGGPGDFDGNGVVNGADLTHPTLGWKARYGIDLDGDDFLIWQRNVAPAATQAAAAVPEPAAWALLLVASVIVLPSLRIMAASRCFA